ncbi:MAG TPA: hypothetical protein VFZ34_11190 [Blastocatellia bacterium]|nr:hypothetical protein [Blastocatellia bacterium]
MDAQGVPRQTTNDVQESHSSWWQWLLTKVLPGDPGGALLQLRNPPPHMINWYDPRQLLHTAVEVFISTTLGRHADRRSIEASNREARFFDFSASQAAPPLPPTDHNIKPITFPLDKVTASAQPKELWIDYVSDLGDGFNSTYAVAHALTQESLRVSGVEEPLIRGNILIFGGDEVYPTADRKEYKERLVAPYHWAWKELPQKSPNPDCLPANAPYLFALPGNHDWYDSLSSFMEFFGDYERDEFAGGWHVPQNRSYFALKLPQGWWLLGVDLQLASDLDYWQIKYFEKIVNLYMQPGDRIILCCAEPFWVFEKLDSNRKAARPDSNLYRLIEILKARQGQTDKAEDETTPKDKQIALYLAGDLHHYFRVWGKEDIEDPNEKNKLQITSGGGGAFLHPTHGAMARAYRSTSFRTNSYPTAWQTWWMGWRNLLFPWFNRRFGAITAGLYFVIGWLAYFSSLDEHNHFQELITSPSLSIYAKACLNTAFHSPLLSVVLLLTTAGFIFFTFTEHNARYFRIGAGVLHAVVQISAAFLLLRFSYFLAVVMTSNDSRALLLSFGHYLPGEVTQSSLNWMVNLLPFLPRFLITGVFLFMGGWIIGSVLMGLYLLVALNIFGQHQTGAFSSLKIQDWKNFLRLKLNLETGELTIYPIGIRRVPRIWQPTGGIAADPRQKPHLQPADHNATAPELIEGPIVITPLEDHVDRVNVSFKGNFTHVKRSYQWLQRYHLDRFRFRRRRPKKCDDQ